MNLPTTDSVIDLAAFWQTHEIVDFGDELTEVVEPVFKRTKKISILLSHEHACALRKRARQEHLSSEALVAKWLQERLEMELKVPG